MWKKQFDVSKILCVQVNRLLVKRAIKKFDDFQNAKSNRTHPYARIKIKPIIIFHLRGLDYR